MRLPSGSAAVNSRSFHGLSVGSETIFACAAFHSVNSLSTAALLSGLSQKRTDKQSAIPPRDSRDATVVIAPIQGETQSADIVCRSLVHIGRGDFRNGSWERHA